MLTKIMGMLGASSPPQFSEIQCGEQGVKTSIKLYLKSGEACISDVVEGEPFLTNDAAEESAITMAYKYLEEACHIRVNGFSSRVARSFGVYNTYGCVNEAMVLVQNMLDNFDMALGKGKELELDLESEEMEEKLSGDVDSNAKMYGELGEYIRGVNKTFSLKTSALRDKMKDLEEARIKHHKRGVEKAKEVASKVSGAD